MILNDDVLSRVYDKASRGEILNVDDIIYMYEQADLMELGKIAGRISRDLWGNRVSFVSNMILNYTNVCSIQCYFCAFYRKPGEDGAYLMSADDIISEVELYHKNYGIKQLLIQGGVNPQLGIEYFTDVFSRIRRRFPDLGIHGLSTSEIYYIWKKAGGTLEEVLGRLRESGLDTIPGAGAEILDEEVRKKIGRPSGSGEQWLMIMETAHRMGIRTSATMMYGHLESNEDKAMHLIKILDLQMKYGGFLSFTPWNFEPGNTRLEREGLVEGRASSQDVLRNIAISRIVFNRHLPVIQTSWLTNGVEMGQLAILFGASDWGGTIYNEKVIPATGKKVGDLRKEIIIKAIGQLGMVPVERDNLYREVKIYNTKQRNYLDGIAFS